MFYARGPERADGLQRSKGVWRLADQSDDLRGRLRHDLQQSHRGWRHGSEAVARSVLRRSFRYVDRSFWSYVDGSNAQGRRLTGRDGEAPRIAALQESECLTSGFVAFLFKCFKPKKARRH